MSTESDNFDEMSFRKEEFQRLAEAELKALDPKDSKEDSKEEVKTEETKSEERTFTELELEQMEKGWDPDHPDGVSAKEFKRVGEIIEAKRKASKFAHEKSREVEDLTKTVKQLIEDQRLTKKMAYEQAIKDLSLQKLEKIREGDVDAVLEIEQRQQALQQQQPTVQESKQTVEVSQEVKAFQEKHKEWLMANTDDPVEEAMRGLVKSRVEHYMKNDPNVSEEIAIKDIEARLAKAFPDRFEAQKHKVSKVSTSTTSNQGQKNYSAGSLSFEQRSEFNAINRVDPTYTIEEYIKQLELIGRIKK